jgi:hypothetical protein
VILYRCKTWSLTLREECTLRVFVKRVFGLKRDEMTGSWRKLHNGELHYLSSLPSITRINTSRRM